MGSMLHQDLPAIESTPLDRWERWLAPALAAIGAGGWRPAAADRPVLACAASPAWRRRRPALFASRAASRRSSRSWSGPTTPWSGPRSGWPRSGGADRRRRITVCRQRRLSGAVRRQPPPLPLASTTSARSGLEMAKSMARRDGAGCVAGIGDRGGPTPVEVERVGAHGMICCCGASRGAAARCADDRRPPHRRRDGRVAAPACCRGGRRQRKDPRRERAVSRARAGRGAVLEAVASRSRRSRRATRDAARRRRASAAGPAGGAYFRRPDR